MRKELEEFAEYLNGKGVKTSKEAIELLQKITPLARMLQGMVVVSNNEAFSKEEDASEITEFFNSLDDKLKIACILSFTIFNVEMIQSKAVMLGVKERILTPNYKSPNG